MRESPALRLRQTVYINTAEAVHDTDVTGLREERVPINEAPQRDQRVDAARLAVVTKEAEARCVRASLRLAACENCCFQAPRAARDLQLSAAARQASSFPERMICSKDPHEWSTLVEAAFSRAWVVSARFGRGETAAGIVPIIRVWSERGHARSLTFYSTSAQRRRKPEDLRKANAE